MSESEDKSTEAEVEVATEASGEGREKHLRKTRVGTVISQKMSKTIVVEVTRRVPHPKFKKIVKKTSRFFVHDEDEKAGEGDRVLIEETRPRSKKKCWDLKEILTH